MSNLKLKSLIFKYEILIIGGYGISQVTSSTAFEIYKTLIDEGKLCEELRETAEIMDIFIVDIGYPFKTEIVLETLAYEISMFSIVDELRGKGIL